MLGGFPGKLAVKLRYTTHESLILAQPTNNVDPSNLTPVPGDGSNLASQFAMCQFRANAPYMPKKFSVVQPSDWDQPMGYDDFEKVYNKVTCIGSKITVRLVPAYSGTRMPDYQTVGDDVQQGDAPMFQKMYSVGSAWNPLYAGIYLTNDVETSIDDINTNIERGSIPSEPKVIRLLKAGGGPKDSFATTMTCKFSPHKHFGIPRKDSIITDDTKGSLTNALPLDESYYTVFIQAVPGSQYENSAHVPMIAQITVDYICLFHDKKPQIGSTAST